MVIWRIRPLAKDHPEDLASCKWLSGGSGLLQIIIWRIWPLANDHPEDPASCKWSSGGSGLLQMIIQRDRLFANDHPGDLASCKWSSGGDNLLQKFIRHPRHLCYLCQDPDSISQTFLEQFLLVRITFLSANVWIPFFCFLQLLFGKHTEDKVVVMATGCCRWHGKVRRLGRVVRWYTATSPMPLRDKDVVNDKKEKQNKNKADIRPLPQYHLNPS